VIPLPNQDDETASHHQSRETEDHRSQAPQDQRGSVSTL
jgi:hypothetical protein